MLTSRREMGLGQKTEGRVTKVNFKSKGYEIALDIEVEKIVT